MDTTIDPNLANAGITLVETKLSSADNLSLTSDTTVSTVDLISDTPPPVTGLSQAFATLMTHMHDDPEYAWAWQCNLAMAFMDTTPSTMEDRHQIANEGAARFMQVCFKIDITKHEHYVGLQKRWDADKAEADSQPDAADAVASSDGTIPSTEINK